MREAFSFIEVIISVVILAFLGTAMLNFNSFNKRAMEKNIMMQDSILLTSSLIFVDKIDNDKEVSLLELTSFKKLNDEDKKFLNSIEMSLEKEVIDKQFLYNDGNNSIYMDYGDLSIKYNDYTINYLWMQRAK